MMGTERNSSVFHTIYFLITDIYVTTRMVYCTSFCKAVQLWMDRVYFTSGKRCDHLLLSG